MNNNLVLISGKSSSGKSASLRNIKNPEGVVYANCENNKALPFKSKFDEKTIVDPMQIYEAFPWLETKPNVHTFVVDTLTYLMDMYESKYVLTSSKMMQAWGTYFQYLKVLMSDHVAKSTKNIFFLAHTSDIYNEAEMVTETRVKVKGSLMANGIESFFSNVISTKKVSLKTLEKYESPLLNISDEEKEDGFKYVFQTRLTKETVGESIRGPLGMWSRKETFIDNDIQHVINKLHEYYK